MTCKIKDCPQKCQICGKQRATGLIKNKLNGNELRICKQCLELSGIEKAGHKEDNPCLTQPNANA